MDSCWICLESEGELTRGGCACRGSAGTAHLSCLVQMAETNPDCWLRCPTCKIEWDGQRSVGMARARVERNSREPWPQAFLDVFQGLSPQAFQHAKERERLLALGNYGCALLANTTDLDGARVALEECLAGRRQLLGPDDPDTLFTMGRLGSLARREGDNAKALPLLKGALEGTQRALGVEHPETLRLNQNTANLYCVMGNHKAARDLMEPCVAAQRRILGNTHPETLGATRALGTIYSSLGDLPKADALLEEVVAASQQTLGREHAETLLGLSNHGQIRFELGHYDEGIGMIQAAHDGLQRNYGLSYEYTKNVAETLAQLLSNKKFLEAAEAKMMDREMTPDDVFLSLCLAQGIHPGDGAADGERDRATVKLVASTMLQQMTDGSGANRAKANRRDRTAAMRAQRPGAVHASVVGLQSRADLNGSRAEVAQFLSEKGRYKCSV